MTTTYEVRRGKAVIGPRHAELSAAKAYAAAHSHFAGQLKVWAIVHDEYEVTEPPAQTAVTQLRPRKAV